MSVMEASKGRSFRGYLVKSGCSWLKGELTALLEALQKGHSMEEGGAGRTTSQQSGSRSD